MCLPQRPRVCVYTTPDLWLWSRRPERWIAFRNNAATAKRHIGYGVFADWKRLRRGTVSVAFGSAPAVGIRRRMLRDFVQKKRRAIGEKLGRQHRRMHRVLHIFELLCHFVDVIVHPSKRHVLSATMPMANAEGLRRIPRATIRRGLHRRGHR